MKYPDKTSGDPSNTEKEVYTVNALHEQKTKQDRNGSVHTYTRDVVGRLTTDAVTTLGTGVDGAVRRLEFNFDTGGRPYQFTSYDASSSGNVVNQVQRDYNGLGQLITEYQAHSGAVNTATSPKVQYAYSEMASGANHSRLTKMIYPNGRTVHFGYDSGLDDSISRLSFLADDNGSGGVGTHLEDLSYLGLSTVVKRAHSQPGVDLTYIKQTGESNGDAGDQYTGLDRFNRVSDQRWIKTSDGSHTDRFQYGYDRNSNRLYEKNLVDATFSELYHANGSSAGYDSLNQLTEMRRGTLSDANSDGVPDTVSTSSRTQVWDFDALGNFDSQTTDGTGQTRSHNKQNQITSIQSLTTPTYDANGNMTGDENGKTLVFDAWNRLVAYKNGSTTLVSNAHDALGRRVIENPGTQTGLFYSAEWQVLEEREGSLVRSQNIWSPVYIDAMILRDRDTDGNGSLEERLYVQHDANYNVSAIVSTSGVVLERYAPDAYGAPKYLNADFTSRSSSGYAWVYIHQGGRFQIVTGLYHFRHRELSAGLGRWVQVDPVGFRAGDVNLFGYIQNAPVSTLDPQGLAKCKCGLDVTDNLRKGLAGVEKGFNELSAYDKYLLCKGIFSFPTGLYGWDIKVLIGDNPETILSKGECGKGQCKGTVTVNGQCFCATAVNYILFGKISRLCYDAGQSPRGLGRVLSIAKLYRLLGYHWDTRMGKSCVPNPADIAVWVEAGWTGDFGATQTRWVSGCPACEQKFLGPSDFVVMHNFFGEPESGWIHVIIDEPPKR